MDIVFACVANDIIFSFDIYDLNIRNYKGTQYYLFLIYKKENWSPDHCDKKIKNYIA